MSTTDQTDWRKRAARLEAEMTARGMRCPELADQFDHERARSAHMQVVLLRIFELLSRPMSDHKHEDANRLQLIKEQLQAALGLLDGTE